MLSKAPKITCIKGPGDAKQEDDSVGKLKSLVWKSRSAQLDYGMF